MKSVFNIVLGLGVFVLTCSSVQARLTVQDVPANMMCTPAFSKSTPDGINRLLDKIQQDVNRGTFNPSMPYTTLSAIISASPHCQIVENTATGSSKVFYCGRSGTAGKGSIVGNVESSQTISFILDGCFDRVISQTEQLPVANDQMAKFFKNEIANGKLKSNMPTEYYEERYSQEYVQRGLFAGFGAFMAYLMAIGIMSGG